MIRASHKKQNDPPTDGTPDLTGTYIRTYVASLVASCENSPIQNNTKKIAIVCRVLSKHPRQNPATTAVVLCVACRQQPARKHDAILEVALLFSYVCGDVHRLLLYTSTAPGSRCRFFPSWAPLFPSASASPERERQ